LAEIIAPLFAELFAGPFAAGVFAGVFAATGVGFGVVGLAAGVFCTSFTEVNEGALAGAGAGTFAVLEALAASPTGCFTARLPVFVLASVLALFPGAGDVLPGGVVAADGAAGAAAFFTGAGAADAGLESPFAAAFAGA